MIFLDLERQIAKAKEQLLVHNRKYTPSWHEVEFTTFSNSEGNTRNILELRIEEFKWLIYDLEDSNEIDHLLTLCL